SVCRLGQRRQPRHRRYRGDYLRLCCLRSRALLLVHPLLEVCSSAAFPTPNSAPRCSTVLRSQRFRVAGEPIVRSRPLPSTRCESRAMAWTRSAQLPICELLVPNEGTPLSVFEVILRDGSVSHRIHLTR